MRRVEDGTSGRTRSLAAGRLVAHGAGCRIALLLGLISTLLVVSPGSGVAAPTLGKPSDGIGNFNGWTFMLGWEGSFSDSYAPEKEKYSWNVFLAPEGIYVGLLAQQAVYSAVDVNMGIKYFYGFIKAPEGAVATTADFLSKQVWAVSFSIGYPDAIPPVGLMSQFSLGFEVEQAFFRIKNTRTIIPGVQYGAGYAAAFSMLPITLPFTVELDRDWVAPPDEPKASLFWPIVLWSAPPNPALHPIDQIQEALSHLGATPGISATAVLIGARLSPLVDQIAADSDLRSYISNPKGSSQIAQAASATETWLVTGDVTQLSDSLKPVKPTEDIKESVRQVLLVTQLAFETGYRVGAEANTNNHTVYIDGVVTNYCVTGEKCSIQVPVAELMAAIPGHTAQDFEGSWIGFDAPTEAAGSFDALGRVDWIQVADGVARYTIAQTLSTAQLLGVRYDDPAGQPLNGNRDVELKRRLILFTDAEDTDHNGIPDFWEDEYELVDRSEGANADDDSATDYEEYVAATDPTNPDDELTVRIDWSSKELVMPFASSVRRYSIEVNTNALTVPSGWWSALDFMGSDVEERIDISPVLDVSKAFFRIRVATP